MQINSNNLFFPFSNPVSTDSPSSLTDPYLSGNNTLPVSTPSNPSIDNTSQINLSFCLDANCNCGLPKKTVEMLNASMSNSLSSNVLPNNPNLYTSAVPSNESSINNPFVTQALASNPPSAYSYHSYDSNPQSNQRPNLALPFGVPAPFLPPNFNHNFSPASAPTTENIEQQNKLQLKLQKQRDLKKQQKLLEAQQKDEAKKQKKKESKKRKKQSAENSSHLQNEPTEGGTPQVGKKHRNSQLATLNPEQPQPHPNYPYPNFYDLNYPYHFPHQFPPFFDPNINPYANPHLSQPLFGVPFNPHLQPAQPQVPNFPASSPQSLTTPISSEGESNKTETISSLFTDMVSNSNESSTMDNLERSVPVPIQNSSFHGNLSPIHTPTLSIDGSFTFEPLDQLPPSHTNPRSMTPTPLPESFASSHTSASSHLPPPSVKKKKKIIVRKASRKDSLLASSINNSPSSQKNRINDSQNTASVRKRTSKVAEFEGTEGEENASPLLARVSKIQKKTSSLRRRQRPLKVAQAAIASQSNLNMPHAATSSASEAPLPPILHPIDPALFPAPPLLSSPPLNPSRVRKFTRRGARTMNVSRPSIAPIPSSTLSIPSISPETEVTLPKPKLALNNIVIYESPEEFINKINLIMNSIPSEENTFEMRIQEFQNKLCSSLKYEDGTDAKKCGARITMKKDDSETVSFYCLFYEGPFSSEGLSEEAFKKFGVADKHYHIEFFEAQGNRKPILRRPRIHMRVSKFHGELSWLQKGNSISGTEVAHFYKVFKDFLKIPMIIFDDAQIKMPHNRNSTNYWLKALAISDPESKTWYQKLLDVDVINIDQWLWTQTGFVATQNREQYNNALQFVREYPISNLSEILDKEHLRSIKFIAKQVLKIQSVKDSSHKIKDLYLRVSQLAKEAIKGPLKERVDQETNLSNLHDILLVLPKRGSKLRTLPYWKAIDVLITTRIFCSGIADLNQVF